jgi:homoserine dehydrogenase
MWPYRSRGGASVRKLTVGLLGCGVVGSGFVRLVDEDRARVASRFGLEIDVKRILVRDLDRIRPSIDAALLTRSALEVIDGGYDVIVELIGGTASAGAFVRRAIHLGSDVVTANKALLAERGAELFRAAADRGVALGFEASICGGVPVVRALQCGIAGDTIERITGILNGTCNYVLTRMAEGSSYDEALLDAQRKGFAEADPTLDVEGIDAAQKLQILAELAFDLPVRRRSVRGIRGLTSSDIADAACHDQVIRLVAEARRVAGGLELVVEPRRLARDHPLSRIVDENNAVQIEGRASGEWLLAGKGAGSMPTAAAVLSDVVEIGRLRHSSAAAVA